MFVYNSGKFTVFHNCRKHVINGRVRGRRNDKGHQEPFRADGYSLSWLLWFHKCCMHQNASIEALNKCNLWYVNSTLNNKVRFFFLNLILDLKGKEEEIVVMELGEHLMGCEGECSKQWEHYAKVLSRGRLGFTSGVQKCPVGIELRDQRESLQENKTTELEEPGICKTC